jgi:hypothetical protein
MIHINKVGLIEALGKESRLSRIETTKKLPFFKYGEELKERFDYI